jgi:hypothetical protein
MMRGSKSNGKIFSVPAEWRLDGRDLDMVGILQQAVNPHRAGVRAASAPVNNRDSPGFRGFLGDYTVGSSSGGFTVFTWQFNIN